MKVIPSFMRFVFPLVLMTLLIPVGCESIPVIGDMGSNSDEPKPELIAVVNVEDPDYGGEIPITVTMSSTGYRDAIGKLRTQKWNDAIVLLNEKIESERKRERLAEAYFARGVAYEVQGQYEMALESYEEAYERANRAEYKDGIDRAKSGLE